MNIRDRWELIHLYDNLYHIKKVLDRVNKIVNRIKSTAAEPADGIFELLVALEKIATAGDDAYQICDRMLDREYPAETPVAPEACNATEIAALEHFAHSINRISEFMHQTADSIRPVMEGHVADESNPLCDFELEARIDFQLREDDPEYSEKSDNYLSSRDEMLKRVRDVSEFNEDWRNSLAPEPFKGEAKSWLLHTLTEHDLGLEAPRVDVRDCLRIGKVYLDIQVWWQYVFDVAEGKWIKRWRGEEGIPEYLETAMPLEGSVSQEKRDASDES